jgi:GT2 family glycosyltransferase
MRLSVVIPNWNGVRLLAKHLQKVIDAARGAEIIVADDHSEDGSVDFIKKNFPSVKVVTGSKQEGFATNVNAGVSRATGSIVVLLNTDVEPEHDFLTPLIADFSDPKVFAVGCLEKSSEDGKTILRGRGLAQWIKGYFIHERGEVNKTDTAWVAGGSGAFRKSMWDKLGGMDTLFNPFYWEDIDLSYRARKAGWKTLFEPKSVVHHYHEEGKIMREYSSSDVNRIAYRNQFIYIWKNVTDTGIILAHSVWTPIRLLQALLRGDGEMLAGYFLAVLKLPQILKHRNIQNRLNVLKDRQLDILK